MLEGNRAKLRELLRTANALLVSMETSIANDPTNVWKYSGYKQYIRKYNQLVQLIIQVEPIPELVDLYDESRIHGPMDTIAIQQKELFESVHANLSILRAWLEDKVGLRDEQVDNIRNFLQANLRRAVFDIPKDELEVQNIVEQLLIGRSLVKGQDYDRETGRVKISVKESIPDFVFPRLGMALEIKLSKDRQRAAKIVDEINADIAAYSKRYISILFLVYDVGSIRDEYEFRHDLESADNITVMIVKH